MSLLRRLKGLNLSDKKMGSFDVKSLFTNVPVKGTMRAIDLTDEGHQVQISMRLDERNMMVAELGR